MEVKTAIDILSNWVKTDRECRSYEVKSDFDKFCEERNVAIETILSALSKQE